MNLSFVEEAMIQSHKGCPLSSLSVCLCQQLLSIILSLPDKMAERRSDAVIADKRLLGPCLYQMIRGHLLYYDVFVLPGSPKCGQAHSRRLENTLKRFTEDERQRRTVLCWPTATYTSVSGLPCCHELPRVHLSIKIMSTSGRCPHAAEVVPFPRASGSSIWSFSVTSPFLTRPWNISARFEMPSALMSFHLNDIIFARLRTSWN